MTKISDLPTITAPSVDTANDFQEFVDMSETGIARNKKITLEQQAIAIAPQLRITFDGLITVDV